MQFAKNNIKIKSKYLCIANKFNNNNFPQTKTNKKGNKLSLLTLKFYY